MNKVSSVAYFHLSNGTITTLTSSNDQHSFYNGRILKFVEEDDKNSEPVVCVVKKINHYASIDDLIANENWETMPGGFLSKSKVLEIFDKQHLHKNVAARGIIAVRITRIDEQREDV